MHLRSADHSFPSSWWQSGTPDIRVSWRSLALGAVALGFRTDARHRPKTLLLAQGSACCFSSLPGR